MRVCDRSEEHSLLNGSCTCQIRALFVLAVGNVQITVIWTLAI